MFGTLLFVSGGMEELPNMSLPVLPTLDCGYQRRLWTEGLWGAGNGKALFSPASCWGSPLETVPLRCLFFFYGHTCNFVSIDQVNDKRLISTPSHTDDQNAQFLLVLLAQRVVSRGLKTNSLLFTTITSKNIRTHEVQWDCTKLGELALDVYPVQKYIHLYKKGN